MTSTTVSVCRIEKQSGTSEHDLLEGLNLLVHAHPCRWRARTNDQQIIVLLRQGCATTPFGALARVP